MTGMEKIKDVTEQVGGSATFKCQLPYEGAPVEWTHNGNRIYPEQDPQKYEIISDALLYMSVMISSALDTIIFI